jgi:hypothetical protein
MKKSIIFFRAALSVAVCAWLLAPRIAQAGSWASVTTLAPNSVELMLLLPDGTIMAADAYNGGYGNAWYKLTPDGAGHYVDGIWSTRHAASYTRLWCSTQVLQNGKVFVAGGEYGTGGATAEVYDPVADGWSTLTIPANLLYTGPSGDSENSAFRDSGSTMIPNGTVMVAPVFPFNANATVIYNPTTSALSQGPLYLASQNEAGWVKLPDTSILTVNKNSTSSERFIPSLNQWIPDGTVPVSLFDPFGAEEGPPFLLPNGKAFFLGGSGHTAIYTPSGTTNAGSWIAGPDIPSGRAMPDAGACMMVNGIILCATTAAPVSGNEFATNIFFYEYNYATGATGAFTQVNGPTGVSDNNLASYQAMMLALPDGKVLYSHFGRDLYIYTPGSGPIAAGKPTINSASWAADGLHVTGTLFNGISQGAAYGDDAQMDTGRPIVQFTSGGTVYYGRTFNWSSTSVATGSTILTTEVAMPPTMPPGSCSMAVIANGIASDPVTIFGPVWVDFNYVGTQTGTYQFPWETLASGVSAVVSGGTISINASVQPSVSHETMTISKPMTIVSVSGPSTIGH